MPLLKCVLDGYTFSYNAPEAANPKVKGVAVTETILGRYFTVFGTDPSRQDITMSWPAMDAAVYVALQTKFLKPGALSFIDDDGTPYTVIFAKLTPQKKVPSGKAYLNVNALFYVVSSP